MGKQKVVRNSSICKISYKRHPIAHFVASFENQKWAGENLDFLHIEEKFFILKNFLQNSPDGHFFLLFSVRKKTHFFKRIGQKKWAFGQ
jgi:hypothetical protein